MICALFELGLEEKTEENYAKGIEELEKDAPVGKNYLEYIGLLDTLYELDVHKHKNNDCYYHIGFAYEIGTILNKKVSLPVANYKEIDDDVNNYVKLNVETKGCPYYIGRMVKNVKVGPSPKWIQERLIGAGMRSINNIVDISNFVMLEYGQPTHFFDYDKLGKNVLVRDALNDEKIITLDKKEIVLASNDIVITDGNKPVCIAGIKGGENVEVDENTKNIFIEAAIFDPFRIRKTSNRLNISTDASVRYGKGLSYEYTKMAIDRCLSLLEEYAGGEVLSGEVIHDEVDKSLKEVTFEVDDINRILGISIKKEDMEHELDRLGFSYQVKDNLFTVTIPNRRLDIDPNVEDIAEEIGRLYGYHNLICSLPKVPVREGKYIGDVKLRKLISKRLRTLGLNEVKTYTLVSPSMSDLFNYENKEHLKLLSPMSIDKSIIRTTLIPSLLNTYSYNKARKVEDINIYEIAKTYDNNYQEESKVAILMSGNYIKSNWNNCIIKDDFYLLKGIVENVLKYLGFKNRYDFIVDTNIKDLHPGISATITLDRKPIGIIGRVHPSLIKDDLYVCEFSLSKLYNESIKPLKYKAASKYPEIKKDVAFIVDNNITNKELMATIKHSGGRILDTIVLFDLYPMNNKKSMAYNLVFKDPNKTLTEVEVMDVFNKIINDVKNKFNCEVRDK